jgi:hypothetical protein
MFLPVLLDSFSSGYDLNYKEREAVEGKRVPYWEDPWSHDSARALEGRDRQTELHMTYVLRLAKIHAEHLCYYVKSYFNYRG